MKTIREKELEEALMLMVYQYCATGTADEGGILDHRFMSAGEEAFRVLGLEQFASVEGLEERLFGPDEKENQS